MNIIPAATTDLPVVRKITQETIRTVYPRYYPQGAVDFFLAHHSDERIAADIAAGIVYLLQDASGFTGTVTLRGNEVCRLFVLSEHQGKGCCRALMDFAENEIFKAHDAIVLDASLPAKGIYLKRGYQPLEYHAIKTDNSDFLCYDVMKKGRPICCSNK